MGKRFSSCKFCASAHLAPFINCLPHPPFESESESESAHLGDFLPLAAVCPDCFSGAGGNLQSWIFGIFSVWVDEMILWQVWCLFLRSLSQLLRRIEVESLRWTICTVMEKQGGKPELGQWVGHRAGQGLPLPLRPALTHLWDWGHPQVGVVSSWSPN